MAAGDGQPRAVKGRSGVASNEFQADHVLGVSDPKRYLIHFLKGINIEYQPEKPVDSCMMRPWNSCAEASNGCSSTETRARRDAIQASRCSGVA